MMINSYFITVYKIMYLYAYLFTYMYLSGYFIWKENVWRVYYINLNSCYVALRD